MTLDPHEKPEQGDHPQPVKLKEDDRRRFYGLLEADLPARVRRMEFMLVALLATSSIRLLGGLPMSPAALIRLIFG